MIYVLPIGCAVDCPLKSPQPQSEVGWGSTVDEVERANSELTRQNFGNHMAGKLASRRKRPAVQIQALNDTKVAPQVREALRLGQSLLFQTSEMGSTEFRREEKTGKAGTGRHLQMVRRTLLSRRHMQTAQDSGPRALRPTTGPSSQAHEERTMTLVRSTEKRYF